MQHNLKAIGSAKSARYQMTLVTSLISLQGMVTKLTGLSLWGFSRSTFISMAGMETVGKSIMMIVGGFKDLRKSRRCWVFFFSCVLLICLLDMVNQVFRQSSRWTLVVRI